MRKWLAILLLAPIAAYADPVTLISYAAGYLLESYVVGAAIYVVGAAYQNSRARKKARDAYNASLRDRLVTVRGSVEPRRMVLGRQRVGGVDIFHGSVGANKEQFVTVLALAGHECDAIEEIWLNDQKVELGLAGNEYVITSPYARTEPQSISDSFTGNGVTVAFTISHSNPIDGSVYARQSVTSTDETQFVVLSVVGNVVTLATAPAGYAFTIGYQVNVTTSFARVRKFLGAPGQTVDSVVSSLFPTDWNSTHPMTGICGLACIFTYSEDAYPAGLPNVSAVVRGAKCYDPRKDSTAGGSGAHRLSDSTTWEWTENPALLIGYAAMSPLCGRQPSTAINWTRAAVAANVCDTPVDYATWGLLVTESSDFLVTDAGDPLRT